METDGTFSTVRESPFGFWWLFLFYFWWYIYSIFIAELFQHLYKTEIYPKWELCKLILVTDAALSVLMRFSGQWWKLYSTPLFDGNQQCSLGFYFQKEGLIYEGSLEAISRSMKSPFSFYEASLMLEMRQQIIYFDVVFHTVFVFYIFYNIYRKGQYGDLNSGHTAQIRLI